MTYRYLCPGCKTNRTRFHIIEQKPRAVKLDPREGTVVAEYEQSALDPFHLPYKGPSVRVQCGACGLIEDEVMFVKFHESHT